jgi:hypothetical protein
MKRVQNNVSYATVSLHLFLFLLVQIRFYLEWHTPTHAHFVYVCVTVAYEVYVLHTCVFNSATVPLDSRYLFVLL